MAHECIQEVKIALLTKDNEVMVKNINDIKENVSDIKDDITLIKEFILTSPIKFASKDEFDIFKNWINTKIAYVSWAFAIIVSIISYLFNKWG